MTNNRKKKVQTTEDAKVKGFLDMIAPSVIQFYTDHYICGNTFRCVWALREYPTATDGWCDTADIYKTGDSGRGKKDHQ
mgnify:CR=1 FL=1